MNLRPRGYAYHFDFRRFTQRVNLWSGLSLHPALKKCWMPAIKSLHLSPPLAETWLGITLLTASPNLTGDHAQIALCAAHFGMSFLRCGLSAEHHNLIPGSSLASYQAAPPRDSGAAYTRPSVGVSMKPLHRGVRHESG